jgi:feruloyl esterase
MGGGGGFVGYIANQAKHSIKNGYATSGTDTGHKGKSTQADWALNNMERQVNYSHLAVHRTAVVSKAIINEYHDSFPDYNYFFGCSNGGSQALKEAQLYAEDFDGIVAGAPPINFIAHQAKFIRNSQIMFPDPDNLDVGLISKAQLKFLQKAVLEQCDEIDGVKDSIINDPHECKFNFENLPVCAKGQNETDCFTPDQIEVLKMLYAGLTVQGVEVYPEYPFGSEIAWWEWIVGPGEVAKQYNVPTFHYGSGTEWYKYVVFNNPEWDYSTYDFSNFFNDTKYSSANFNATSTDYSAFNARGGKMIIYHGWNDPALSANASIKYYEDVRKAEPSVDNFLKLFLLPGVNHCGGGPGPSQVDWIEIIRDWVEKGNAPERIKLSKSENGEVILTRPVYPYPRIAVYDGSGDPNVESSFIEKK